MSPPGDAQAQYNCNEGRRKNYTSLHEQVEGTKPGTSSKSKLQPESTLKRRRTETERLQGRCCFKITTDQWESTLPTQLSLPFHAPTFPVCTTAVSYFPSNIPAVRSHASAQNSINDRANNGQTTAGIHVCCGLDLAPHLCMNNCTESTDVSDLEAAMQDNVCLCVFGT